MRLKQAKSQPTTVNHFVKLHSQSSIDKFRIAGKCVSETMSMLESLVASKQRINLLEYDKIAEENIIKLRCTPTFKGYKGFPNAVCISVNNQLVHGIPVDYYPKEGDLISFDFGATYDGCIADSAITVIYGKGAIEDERLVKACYEALARGIGAVRVGGKVGEIGHAIYRSAKGNGYSVVENYGGHGIGYNNPHSGPFISNKSNIDEGIRIQNGFCFAIEPLLFSAGQSSETKIAADGWTVEMKGRNAHFEHSLFIHDNNVEVITKRPGEV